MAGKPHVVAGSRKNWFQVTAATHLPDQIISKMQATMTKPGSGGYDGCGSPLL